MRKHKKPLKLAIFCILLFFMLTMMCACWDSLELNEMFIVTAIGLDTDDDPDKITITFQIANIKQQGQGAEQGQNKEEKVIVIKHHDETISEAIDEINRDSERILVLNHLQVLAIGEELAQKGIRRYLDLFVRDLETRLETPIVIVKGRAEDLITAHLAQETNSGIFMRQMFEVLAKISKKTRERLTDLLSCLIDKTCESAVPYIAIQGEEGKQEVRLLGMAVFKADKVVGALDIEQTEGFVWAMGKVKGDNLKVISNKGIAIFNIRNLKSKTTVSLKDDKKVQVTIKIDSKVSVNELEGFDNMEPESLMKYLTSIAEQQIKEQVIACFERTKELQADIFGFGNVLKQTDQKGFQTVENNWDSIYCDIELHIKPKVKIESTGLILKPIKIGADDDSG